MSNIWYYYTWNKHGTYSISFAIYVSINNKDSKAFAEG